MQLPGTVLLVEPDISIKRDIHAHLESRGHIVLDGESLATLHDLAVTTHPDLVLVDGDDRFSLSETALSRMQRDDRTADVPIVVLGNGDAVLSRTCETIQKPIDGSVLVGRVESALELHRLKVEMRAARNESKIGEFIDELTGLNGTRRLLDELAHHTATTRRYGGHLSMVLFDIDRIGDINERHGRDAGDAVLRDAAQRLAADVRTSDIVGRWRADQFMALLPCTPLDGAMFFAERFRQILCEFPTRSESGESYGFTASFGCVEGIDEIEMVRAAEAAIGLAKRSGRNCVVSAGVTSHPLV